MRKDNMITGPGATDQPGPGATPSAGPPGAAPTPNAAAIKSCGDDEENNMMSTPALSAELQQSSGGARISPPTTPSAPKNSAFTRGSDKMVARASDFARAAGGKK